MTDTPDINPRLTAESRCSLRALATAKHCGDIAAQVVDLPGTGSDADRHADAITCLATAQRFAERAARFLAGTASDADRLAVAGLRALGGDTITDDTTGDPEPTTAPQAIGRLDDIHHRIRDVSKAIADHAIGQDGDDRRRQARIVRVLAIADDSVLQAAHLLERPPTGKAC